MEGKCRSIKCNVASSMLWVYTYHNQCSIRFLRTNVYQVNIGAHQDAVLQLSSVNLPSGVQRIRTQKDELEMRQLFIEVSGVCIMDSVVAV